MFLIGAVVVVMLFSGLRGMETTTPQSVAATANAEYEQSQVKVDPDGPGPGAVIVAIFTVVLAGGMVAAFVRSMRGGLT